jgi:hypothetical protein
MQLRDTGKGVKSLDNGEPPASSSNGNKKRKRATQQATEADTRSGKEVVINTASSTAAPGMPKLLPGERLADFAARVNQALPVAGLARKAKTIDGVKERQTKHEKKLQKLVSSWKVEEARRIEKVSAENDMAEEEEEREKFVWQDRDAELSRGKRKGRRKEKEDDAWADLKRDKPKGIHDVVQAPPTLSYKAKNPFKANSARVENVPNASGNLKRREELGETRLGLIERYRSMMREQRAS